MDDQQKSKETLIEELHDLRGRVAELERAATELAEAQAALALAGEQYRSLFENAGDSIFIVDPAKLTILDANKNAARRLGYTRDEMVGRPLDDFEKPLDAESGNAVMFESMISGTTVAEYIHHSKDGRTVPVEVSSRMVRYGDRLVWQRFARDISERKRIQAELERLATIDPLTGALNRRSFFDRAEKLREIAIADDSPLAIIMLDIDHFKQVNDTFGHAMGDEALRRCTATCKHHLRDDDLFGRYGGEEFVAVLPDTSTDDAAALAETIRTALEGVSITTASTPLRFTASFGVSAYDPAEDNIEPALNRADEGLYHAKRTGRNRVVRFSEVPTDESDDH